MLQVKAKMNAPTDKVWNAYNSPEDIRQWNTASFDWHCPYSENDLRPGGRFRNTMAAKDGRFSFDFSGIYDEVVIQKLITYTMDDGRKAVVVFEDYGAETGITVSFDAEQSHTEDFQKEGWQAILNNFKNYIENK